MKRPSSKSSAVRSDDVVLQRPDDRYPPAPFERQHQGRPGRACRRRPKGTRVNAVAPGPYRTLLQPSGGRDPDKLTHFGAYSLMGRPGQPAGIAPLYVRLASNRIEVTSGDIFASTGGKPQG